MLLRPTCLPPARRHPVLRATAGGALVALAWLHVACNPHAELAARNAAARCEPLRVDTPDGRHRTALLVVPDGAAPPSGRPLVVMLHGAGGSAQHVVRSTHWDELAEQESFVAAFPDGTAAQASKPARFGSNPQTWNSGAAARFIADQRHAVARGVDDVGFLEQMLQAIGRQTPIDRHRIYLAGHSNGAAMAYRLASERPELVAAVGVMAGHLPAGLGRLTSPVSLLALSGDQDPFAPLEGGLAGWGRHKEATLPMQSHVAAWARANGLTHEPRAVQDDAHLRTLQWGPDPAGTEVRWVVIRGHGHAWPGGYDPLPRALVGPRASTLDATRAMWAFFRAHPKPRPAHLGTR